MLRSLLATQLKTLNGRETFEFATYSGFKIDKKKKKKEKKTYPSNPCQRLRF